MANEKTQVFKTRMIQKHDSSNNWSQAINFIPQAGELIIYDNDKIKIGDGAHNPNELPFSKMIARSKTTEKWNALNGTIPVEGEICIYKDPTETKIKIGDGITSLEQLPFLQLGNKNLKDGKAEGSLRTSGSAVEDEAYSLGVNAFASGIETKASGMYSHTEGGETEASGAYSHAEGYQTLASGDGSHTEGSLTQTSGLFSHAEGDQTEAIGDFSHAEGKIAKASGENSHAEGLATKASSSSQHVQGRYNIEDTASKYADIIGNGQYGSPSNAATVDWNGNAWFADDVRVGGTSQDDPAAISLKKTFEKIDGTKIPTKLPNPNALTFTGAATGTYDGSQKLQVHIPTTSEIINALPKWKWGIY